MKISHNVPALQSVTHLGITGRKLEKSTLNLSTAKQLRTAKDNPAGMAVVNKLMFQTTGLNTASKNSTDGISIVQTAEGALQEVHSMLQRMRELSVFASTGSLMDDDREKIQTEIDQLKAEITSISERTEFNKIKLLNGHASRVAFTDDLSFSNTTLSRLNASKYAEVTYVSDEVPPGDLKYTIISAGRPALAAIDVTKFSDPGLEGVFSINSINVAVDKDESFDDRLTKLMKACDLAAVDVVKSVNTTPEKIYLMTREAGKSKEIEFLTEPEELLDDLLGLGTTKVYEGTDAVIGSATYSDQSFDSTITVTTDGNRSVFSSVNGQKIVIELKTIFDPETGQFVYNDEDPMADPPTAANGLDTPVEMGARVTDYGPLIIQIGPNAKMELKITIPVVTSESLGLKHLNVQTQKDAMCALDTIDTAMGYVSSIRAKLGAYQNRLEHTIDSLNTTAENVETSRSRLQDTNIAAEMASYTSLKVIEQAAMAVLAQANQRPMEILSLLGK